MSNFAKFMKVVMAKKRKLEYYETVKLTEKFSAILQRKLPQKVKDLSSFTVPCTIRDSTFGKALCDLGVSINLIPLSVFRKLGLGEFKPTTISLQMADHSLTFPKGIIEDVLVKVDKFIFLVDFVVLDMEEDREIPLILGQTFLAINLTLRVNDKEVHFNIYHTMKFLTEEQSCNWISMVDECVKGIVDGVLMDDPLEHYLVHLSFRKLELSSSEVEFSEVDVEDEQIECTLVLDSSSSVSDPEEKLEVTSPACESEKGAKETVKEKKEGA